jgi:phosphate transport system permease protein
MSLKLDPDISSVARASGADTPLRAGKPRADLADLGLSAVAAAAGVWVLLHLAGWDAPLGFVVCWFGAFLAIYGVITQSQHGLLVMKDRLATVAITAGTAAALLPLFLIVLFVLRQGFPVVMRGFPHFLTHDLKQFGPTDPSTRAGVAHAIIGNIEQVGIATAITVPIGILAATYLNEVGGRYASAIRTVAAAMTGLPTIIAGLLVYAALIFPVGVSGFRGFAGGLALSVVMLPTIVRASEEVLRIVHDSLREAALALGAPEWRMVTLVVLPTARAGLVTAAILGVARAIGETAPVLLTVFGSKTWNPNPFHAAQANLTITIYELQKAPTAQNVAVAWGAALVLVTLVLILFTIARVLGSQQPGKEGRIHRIRRQLFTNR